MIRDTKKYPHGIKRIWVHMSFKIKYCHNIFNIKEVRNACQQIFEETAKNNNIDVKYIGFDANHIHFVPDLGHKSESEMRKVFKGTSGMKLFRKFPWLKRRYFWGSGFWGRQYYCYAIGSDMNQLANYVKKQKYFTAMNDPCQMGLERYYQSK